MYFLRLTSKLAERFRIAYPQYWLDKLMADIHQANEGGGGPVLTGQILAILRHPQLEREVTIPGVNLVTNDGDVYYAQSSVAESPTDDFDAAAAGLRLGSAVTAVTKTDTDVTTFLAGTGHVLDATYPLTNDADADNTGAGTDIVTWTYSYLTSEGNAAGIAEGAIVDDRTTPTAALTHFLFAATFTKSSSDTLKCIVNHEILGV